MLVAHPLVTGPSQASKQYMADFLYPSSDGAGEIGRLPDGTNRRYGRMAIAGDIVGDEVTTNALRERDPWMGITFEGFGGFSFPNPTDPNDWLISSKVAGDALLRFYLTADGRMGWGNGTDAADTDLYRALPSVLATNDSFRVGGVLGLIANIVTERSAGAGVMIDGVKLKNRSVSVPDLTAAGSIAIESAVLGDAEFRFRRQADGTMMWGDGALAPDTNLYRDAAGTLKTDDDFVIGTLSATAISAGAADSESAGFRSLRVPN